MLSLVQRFLQMQRKTLQNYDFLVMIIHSYLCNLNGYIEVKFKKR